MRDRTLKELIPDGWEMKRFDSHATIMILYDEDGNRLEEAIIENIYKPHLTIQNKSIVTAINWQDNQIIGYQYKEHTTNLSEGEVCTLMQLFTNQPTTGEWR